MKPPKYSTLFWLQIVLFLVAPHLAFGGGKVHVSGYTRKDGTYVQPYTRRAPGEAGSSSDYNNTPSSSSAPKPVIQSPLDPEKEEAKKRDAAAKLLSWHMEQAEKGNPHGQYSMGLRYLDGDGVPKDEELGRSWLMKAAKQGHTDAYVTLKNRDYFETKRDENGRIIRSSTARHDFMKQTGFPNGRPGYVIDHIIPLKRGGCDCPENMQWQTVEEGKAKDKWE